VASKEGHPSAENQSSNTLPRITSRDRLGYPDATSFRRIPSSPTINNMNTSSGNISNNYGGSLGTLPGLGFGSVYMKVWLALCQMETDPYPEVIQLCQTLTGHIRSLVKEQRELMESRNSSMSLPPSPNRGPNFLSGSESPPAMYQSGDFQSKLNRSAVSSSRTRRKKNSMDEISDEQCQIRKPLVNTNFVEWSSKQFVRRSKNNIEYSDPESYQCYEREWRRIRNDAVRVESLAEQKRVVTGKIEIQVFQVKIAVPPIALQLHPFEQQLAVSGNDSYAVWDWGTAAKNFAQHQRSAIKGRLAKVTALEWVNGHDLDLLLTAADDGSIRVWRPSSDHSQPTFVTGWQAFNNFASRPSTVLLAWEQWTQTLITTGDTRILRFWDLEKELKTVDIPTGTDASVTCVDSSYSGLNLDVTPLVHNESSGDGKVGLNRMGYAVAGCSDGSVRLFDRRCSAQDARVKVWMEHSGTVLAVQLKDNLIISGSTEGDVKLYDIRKNDSLHTNTAIPKHLGMSSMSIHRSANTYACGSPSQFVSVFSLNGNALNTIRTHEGFMGQKLGPVNCLSFHPHKVLLAAGTSDCNVLVYSMDPITRR